jgi:hypothetical protein
MEEQKVFVWMHDFKKDKTLSYLFCTAANVSEARTKILEKAKAVKETITECVFNSEGTEYRYKSSSMGAKDGVLHLSAPNSATTEEICYYNLEEILKKDPVYIAPQDSVGFVTAASN